MTDSQPKEQASEAGKSDATKPEALEKEFEAQVAKPGKQVDPVRQYVERQIRQEEVTARDKGVADTVSSLKEESTLKQYSDSVVRGYMYDYASRNPDFDAAFKTRAENPEKWEKALDKARAAAVEDFGGTTTRTNLRAANLATRGTSNEAPRGTKTDDATLNKMSDGDFKRHVRSLPDFVPSTSMK